MGSDEDEDEFSEEEQDAPLKETEDQACPIDLSLSRTPTTHTAPPRYDRGGFGRPWTSSSPSRRRPPRAHPPPPLILVDRQEQVPAAVRAMYQDMARNPSTYAQPLKPTSKPPPLTLESIGLPPIGLPWLGQGTAESRTAGWRDLAAPNPEPHTRAELRLARSRPTTSYFALCSERQILKGRRAGLSNDSTQTTREHASMWGRAARACAGRAASHRLTGPKERGQGASCPRCLRC